MRTLLALCATLAPLLVAGLDCPTDYKDLGLGDNRCYMYSTENTSWTLAYTSCLTSADGKGNLLSIPDAISFYPQYFETREMGQDLWIGLLDIAGQYSWADETPYDHSIDDFISPDAGDELYGYLSGEDGLIYFADANTKRGYACYVDLSEEATTTEAPPPQSPCDTDWVQYGETCYLFSQEQDYWPSVGHVCHGMDAEMISINDTNLLTYLLVNADSATTYWTGLENQGTIYVWEDGSPTDNVTQVLGPYLDEWVEGSDSDCVALLVSGFPEVLKHMNCLTQQNYICYKPAATDETFAFESWL